jgi:hypothetical protein
LFTGPFNTAATLLQVSGKCGGEAMERKIQLAGKENVLVKEGFLGDNKIFKAFQFRGYTDCLTQMGKEGFRGLYKGNLTAIILGLFNTKIRTNLYEELNKISNFS